MVDLLSHMGPTSRSVFRSRMTSIGRRAVSPIRLLRLQLTLNTGARNLLFFTGGLRSRTRLGMSDERYVILSRRTINLRGFIVHTRKWDTLQRGGGVRFGGVTTSGHFVRGGR